MRWRHQTLSVAASVCLDLMAGTVSALACMFIIVFLSPPLPVYSSTCGTGHNAPEDLLIAGFLVVVRLAAVAYATKPSSLAPIDLTNDLSPTLES